MEVAYEKIPGGPAFAEEGIHIITEATSNGRRVQVLLEELSEVYGLKFTLHLIELDSEEQKKPWYRALNPNGRIPLLLHRKDGRLISVMESTAILCYLVEHFDPDHKFSFTTPEEQSQTLQWLFFWHASTGVHTNAKFVNALESGVSLVVRGRAREEILERYQTLEAHLSGQFSGRKRQWLAGHGTGRYSIADIGAWSHVKSHSALGIPRASMQDYPCLLEWIDEIARRPAVARAMSSKYESAQNPDLVIQTEYEF